MKVGTQNFVLTKYDSLDGKTVCAFTTEEGSFTLRASKSGVTIDGRFELTNQTELQEFAKLMSDVWTQHRKLTPKLSTSLSGH